EEYVRAWLPGAITCFHELTLGAGDHKNMTVAQALVTGQPVSLNSISNVEASHDPSSNVILFAQLLTRAGLIIGSFPRYRATEIGKKIFRMAGYAELVLSYYDMLQNLHALLHGEKSYGLDGDVNRDGWLNSRASNSMTAVRVAPYIVEALERDPNLRQCFTPRSGAYLDYGSGGGAMMAAVAGSRFAVDSGMGTFGIDVSPSAVASAKDFLSRRDLRARTSVMCGSILKKDDLKRVSHRMNERRLPGCVASINAILHDVGPDKSRVFLRNHADVFGATPLLVTEIYRMPDDVTRPHPNRMPTTFEFMHTASGQHLFTEPELDALLAEEGYTINDRRVHTTMPGVEKGTVHPHVVTLHCRYERASG
ncbi:MAG: hypothetical protein AAB592_01240, partial [Patescibacteria group bacterium]